MNSSWAQKFFFFKFRKNFDIFNNFDYFLKIGRSLYVTGSFILDQKFSKNLRRRGIKKLVFKQIWLFT